MRPNLRGQFEHVRALALEQRLRAEERGGSLRGQREGGREGARLQHLIAANLALVIGVLRAARQPRAPSARTPHAAAAHARLQVLPLDVLPQLGYHLRAPRLVRAHEVRHLRREHLRRNAGERGRGRPCGRTISGQPAVLLFLLQRAGRCERPGRAGERARAPLLRLLQRGLVEELGDALADERLARLQAHAQLRLQRLPQLPLRRLRHVRARQQLAEAQQEVLLIHRRLRQRRELHGWALEQAEECNSTVRLRAIERVMLMAR